MNRRKQAVSYKDKEFIKYNKIAEFYKMDLCAIGAMNVVYITESDDCYPRNKTLLAQKLVKFIALSMLNFLSSASRYVRTIFSPRSKYKGRFRNTPRVKSIWNFEIILS